MVKLAPLTLTAGVVEPLDELSGADEADADDDAGLVDDEVTAIFANAFVSKLTPTVDEEDEDEVGDGCISKF